MRFINGIKYPLMNGDDGDSGGGGGETSGIGRGLGAAFGSSAGPLGTFAGGLLGDTIEGVFSGSGGNPTVSPSGTESAVGGGGGGGLGQAIGTVGGALITGALGSKAASESTQALERGAESGISEQRRQFDITQANLQPFQQAGVSAIEQQQALLGLSGQEAQQQAFSGIEESRGQQFLRERGQKNLLRNAAAIGSIGGGNVREALVQQGVGFAQQDLQNQFGRLGQLAGQGQSAATNVGQFGAQAAGNIANLQQSGAQARSSGILGQNQAVQQGIAGIATGVAQSGLFSGGLFGGGSGNQFTNSFGGAGQNPVGAPIITPFGGR